MELLSVKLIVLVLMGAVRIVCGMLPLAIVKTIKRRWSKSADRRLKKCISILVFFGGGVMLATCFLHMMPEVQESFNEALPNVHLPIPQVIFVMGFFLVYMIEDIVHALIHKRKRAKRERKNKKGKSSPNGNGGNQKNGNLTQSRDTFVEGGDILGSPYNNNDSPVVAPSIAVIGKDGGYFNEALCYTNTHPDHHYRKQHSVTDEVTPRETKELFDKNIVKKCDDIPGLPKNRIISTTNIQMKRNGATGNDTVAGGGNGLIGGVEKFSYIDPDWFRDTVIANSQINLLGNSTQTLASSNMDPSNSLHDLHLNKSQNINVISDDSNSSSGSSGSTSCSRKNLSGGVGDKNKKDIQSSHALDDDHDDHDHFHQEHSHLPVAFIDGEDELDQTIGAEIRNLLIVIAISFHGIFEGMAIGLQDTEEDVWYMFFAVSLHECTILFCIGVELISNKTKVFRMVLYVLIVSLVSPIGIAIGIVITERSFGTGSVQTLVVGCFQGLAAGSLLYVTFFEIFQEEGRKLHRKCIHILVAIIGFVLMGCLEFIGGHSHGGARSRPHSHSHGNETWDDHSDHDHGHAPTGYHNTTDEDHHHNHDDDHVH